ncbi:FecR domain-containing protein [Pseudomonas sp. 21LCFQ02]|uniref:FecR family protein n=1 Tax=Pseudomonas sp. 21LCFQ02 TaxID=2957505 RepID=UPI00209B10BB|nr:FecR domain-containing protein [Pseudomonas sp. 21LCFQ02]MCO8171465.1 FecR domain-containing protein [Pseudomonas sp. 21LCFQ02]
MKKPDDRPPREDALQPYTDALRERVPSREALLAEGKAQTKRRKQRNAAAGGLLSLAIAAAIWTFDPSWRSEDIQVALGQRQQLSLADGSQVVLNSGTRLRIEHRLRSRQLELLQGEAMFTVVHGEKPFIVRSQGVQVRDIGTVFDVRSDRRGVQVAVIEGEVEVNNLHNTPRRVLAGEQLRASAELIDRPQPANTQALTAWQHGKLRFNGTPLSEVVADLQHYRQAPIRVADARTGELRLSGEFDSASVEALINLLPNILPVTVQRGSDGSLTLYRSR